MEAKIIRIGNSRGVRLPKTMLEEAGLTEKVRLTRIGGKIIIEPIDRHPREGWENAFPGGKEPLGEEDLEWIDAPVGGDSEW